MKARPDPPPPARPSRWRLRFALLGGGVAWLLHLLLVYLIAEFGTLSGLAHHQWGAGLGVVSWLLLGCSAVMLSLAVVAIVVARALLRTSREPLRFCARLGLASNVAFSIIIAVQTIPIFYFLSP